MLTTYVLYHSAICCEGAIDRGREDLSRHKCTDETRHVAPMNNLSAEPVMEYTSMSSDRAITFLHFSLSPEFDPPARPFTASEELKAESDENESKKSRVGFSHGVTHR